MDAMPNIHPLQSLQEAVGDAGIDPRPSQRSSLFNNANDGLASIIAKVSGVQSGGEHEDDGPYFTNNEGIPWPDPAHSKTVSGNPVSSDMFLFLQQHFSRHMSLERMVHPCGNGAFSYFEATADALNLTKANSLSGKGDKTPIFMRLSAVMTGRKYPDSVRNSRGLTMTATIAILPNC